MFIVNNEIHIFKTFQFSVRYYFSSTKCLMSSHKYVPAKTQKFDNSYYFTLPRSSTEDKLQAMCSISP